MVCLFRFSLQLRLGALASHRYLTQSRRSASLGVQFAVQFAELVSSWLNSLRTSTHWVLPFCFVIMALSDGSHVT